MGLLDTIRSVIGLDSVDEKETIDEETDVTVEHESDTPAEPEETAAEAEPEVIESAEGEAAEPVEEETAEPDEPAETDADEPAETDADEPAETDADEPSAEASEPVQSIKGIGPAYGDRLADAGVETVGDLAAADADSLAAESEISEGRLETWIGRAQARID